MKKESKKADPGVVATGNEDEKHFKWEELPFVKSRGNGKSLWDPEKQISAKQRSLSMELIGEEFALAYLKLIKGEWPQVGLVSLFFIARDMSKGKRLDGCGGIERSFFDMIDDILREHCINLISIDKIREQRRARVISWLARGGYPKTEQLEVIKTMGKLNELLWEKKGPGAGA